MIRWGRVTDVAVLPRNICDPTSSNHHNSGGLHVKNNKPRISQLRALETHTPIFGSVAQIRKCHFGMTLGCLDISSKKSCL